MSDYQIRALKFLEDTNTSFKAKFHHHGLHFDGDATERDIYTITLKNDKCSFSFKFGQSVAGQGKTPTAYDVLSCVTKNDPGSFKDFCSDFGYDTDSKKAERTYKAVVKEWKKISTLFSEDQLTKLQEIN